MRDAWGYKVLQAVSHLSASFKPGGFSAISRWSSEATPPDQNPMNGTMGWALRTSRYRYVEWRSADFSAAMPAFGNRAQAAELYDYQADPLESENLADKTEYAAILREQQDLFDRTLPHLPKRQK